MRFVLATRSTDKVREIRQILNGISGIRLLTLDEVGIPRGPEEENVERFDTFLENAIAKALYFSRSTDLPVIADDSGLSVDALNGAPGVRSKRFAGNGDLSGLALDQANNALLLERLQGIPMDRRTAHFTCAVAVARRDRPILTTIGTCSGVITDAPGGQGGFGYDPLFLLPDLGATFAQVAPEEKNRRSHRARAFRALAADLSNMAFGVDDGPANR